VTVTPDQTVYWRWGFVVLNATIVNTWIVMALLVVVSRLATRRVQVTMAPSRWQNALEAVVATIRSQIREISQDDPKRYVPFVGTLFLLIATANVLTIIPWYDPPTGSLSTTAALAACVFVATPAFAIARKGLRAYLRDYIRPTPLMLPFNIIGELSRTLALAVRLFGNIMSGVLISLTPLFFPALMQAFGVLIGLIQAYIFAVLAMVYIASAARREHQKEEDEEEGREDEKRVSASEGE